MCSSSSQCCSQELVSVCLPQQNFTFSSAGETLFGPNPTPVAATGLLSNDSTGVAPRTLTYTFRKGTTVVATYVLSSSQTLRTFTVPGFTSISVTSSVTSAGTVANLCMTEFFRAAV